MSSDIFSEVEILRLPEWKATVAAMVTRIRGKTPPRLYIEEWMAAIPIDRKRLAARMHTTPGTITKKLADPAKIDMAWLMRFAEGLGREDFKDLFRHPNAPAPSELLKGLDEATQQEIVRFADFVRSRAVGGDE